MTLHIQRVHLSCVNMHMQWETVLAIFRTIGMKLKSTDHSREDLFGIGLTRLCCWKRMERKCGVMEEIGEHRTHPAIIILCAMVLWHPTGYGILMLMK